MNEALSFRGPPVCIVGNVNRDVKLGGVAASRAVLEDGETPVESVIETIGGGGANSACAAAALGARVRFLGKTGADALGDRLLRRMETLGIGVRVARDSSRATGTSVALGYTNGHRHFLSCLPNNQSLRFSDLDLAALDGCAHLLRADVWFSQQMLEEGNGRLLEHARRRGLATSLDINYDPEWSAGPSRKVARRKKLLRAILPLVDLAHGNIRELREFTDCASLESALRRLSDWGVKATVVHMGRRGAGYYAAGQWTVEPANIARHAVTATGSGDVLSLCMILLHGRQDRSIREKLRLSNRIVREFIEGRRTIIPVI